MKTAKSEPVEFHQPVLIDEALAHLQIRPQAKYVDATLGGGGHAEKIVQADGQLLSLDVDPEALAFSGKRLVLACPPSAYQWKLVKSNFAHLKEVAQREGFNAVDGILFDLGVSTHQLTSPERGFSFQAGELDMRMSPDLGVKAADLVNGLGVKELIDLFTCYGEEPEAAKIAHAIVKERRSGLFKDSVELASLVGRVKKERKPGRNPATRVFQALRIAVNDELNVLKEVLPQAKDLLNKNGRLVVISFHSLEDRVVKNTFRQWEEMGEVKILTTKPVTPSVKELRANPRSRSAKLRAALKIK